MPRCHSHAEERFSARIGGGCPCDVMSLLNLEGKERPSGDGQGVPVQKQHDQRNTRRKILVWTGN